MWVEQARRKRKCHRCDGPIDKGSVMVLTGDPEEPREASCLCAACFELAMDNLTRTFLELREDAMPYLSNILDNSPRCFDCGQTADRCRCGYEAYR